MAGVAFAVEGDGVGFATESYAASALYTTLASLSGALWRIRRAKRLQLIKEVVPSISRVALLWNPDNASNAVILDELRIAAPSLGLRLIPVEARKLADFAPAFA